MMPAACRSTPPPNSASNTHFAPPPLDAPGRAVRLHHVRNARAPQHRGAARRQQVVARVQVRDIEVAGMRAQPAGEPSGHAELPAVGGGVRQIGEHQHVDAVGRAFAAGREAPRRLAACGAGACLAIARVGRRDGHVVARRGKRVGLRRDDARDAAVRPRVLEVRRDVEDAEGAHIAKVYYTGPMTGGTNRRPWLPVALAAVAAAMAALVYLNALNNPFVYDDHRVVLENYSIRDLSNLRALFLNDVFRPVVNISYALDYARSGLAPAGFHLTSLLLHMANVVLLFVLVRVLAGDARAMRYVPAADPAAAADRTNHRAAFASAAVWAVHPLMTQAVGYVSGRSELLCALFMLTSFLCLHAWLFRGGAAWLAAGIASWMLALASKEVAVMLPVVLVVYGTLLLPREDGDIRRRLARVYIPMLAFVAVAAAGRIVIFAGVENVSRASFSWSNILVGLDVVRRYTALMFMTAPQSIFHSARPALVDPQADGHPECALDDRARRPLPGGSTFARRWSRSARSGSC